jgi:DNA-binding transcriptional LysR family regulator
LKPAGSLRFSLYDQVIQAALGGQGVALGRIPLISELLRDGRLIAPFPKRYDSPRGYFVVRAPHAADRPDVGAFAAWLQREAAAQSRADALPAPPQRATAGATRRPTRGPTRKERP